MDPSRRYALLFFYLAAGLSHGATENLAEGYPSGGRGEGEVCHDQHGCDHVTSQKILPTDTATDISSTAATSLPTNLPGKSWSPVTPARCALHDARNKKKRRVGFSHRDILADDSHRPYMDAFRDSLLERAEKDEFLAYDDAATSSRSDILVDENTGADAGEVTKSEAKDLRVGIPAQARRYLAAADPAEDPFLYPAGGTYHHPIAVSLVSSDNSVIYYTFDGTEPTAESNAVKSGELIVVEESVTLRAIASFKGVNFSAYASGETQATFVVYSTGKCGHAYFVPHFTSSGYSGTLVEVDLKTTALGSVRLHGVVTDFADFYSSGGVGPYQGQVSVHDLTGDDDASLAGYWGGFSGDVSGFAMGFLSPLFNGDDFHGNAVQVHLDNFGRENVTRFCGSDAGRMLNATCVFTVLNLEEVDPDLRGFSGGFLYDGKAYFVPSQNGRGGGAKFVRADARNFSSDSVEPLDLLEVDSEVGGFFGGFAAEGYGYLVPSRSFKGPVGGVNTNLSADGMAGSSLLGDSWGARKAGRLESSYSGKLVRVNLTDFSPSGVQVLDLTMVDPDLRGFTGGFAAGHWGFLVPYKNREVDDEYSGKMVRFELLAFDMASITVLDLTQVAPSLRGFVGGFTHGRYAVLSPYANGNTTHNFRGRSQSSEIVFVDLNDFTAAGVHVVDLAVTSRQQIPYQPDPNLRGYVGGFSLGPHVYLAPQFNGVFFGKVVRVDMREMLTMAAGERAASYDGLQVLDLEYNSRDNVGFSGAFHSWDTSCY